MRKLSHGQRRNTNSAIFPRISHHHTQRRWLRWWRRLCPEYANVPGAAKTVFGRYWPSNKWVANFPKTISYENFAFHNLLFQLQNRISLSFSPFGTFTPLLHYEEMLRLQLINLDSMTPTLTNSDGSIDRSMSIQMVVEICKWSLGMCLYLCIFFGAHAPSGVSNPEVNNLSTFCQHFVNILSTFCHQFSFCITHWKWVLQRW